MYNNKLKPSSTIQAQIVAGKRCKVDGCNEYLTIYKGEGESNFCREHQLGLASHGGLGRSDRPYTANKKWVCSRCGYNPKEDPAFDCIANPKHKDSVQRAMMIGDHIIRDSDLGDGSKKNIQTLCFKCNAIKSAEAGDWNSRKKMSA